MDGISQMNTEFEKLYKLRKAIPNSRCRPRIFPKAPLIHTGGWQKNTRQVQSHVYILYEAQYSFFKMQADKGSSDMGEKAKGKKEQKKKAQMSPKEKRKAKREKKK